MEWQTPDYCHIILPLFPRFMRIPDSLMVFPPAAEKYLQCQDKSRNFQLSQARKSLTEAPVRAIWVQESLRIGQRNWSEQETKKHLYHSSRLNNNSNTEITADATSITTSSATAAAKDRAGWHRGSSRTQEKYLGLDRVSMHWFGINTSRWISS